MTTFKSNKVIQIPNFKIVLSIFLLLLACVGRENCEDGNHWYEDPETPKKMKIRKELMGIQQLEMSTK